MKGNSYALYRLLIFIINIAKYSGHADTRSP